MLFILWPYFLCLFAYFLTILDIVNGCDDRSINNENQLSKHSDKKIYELIEFILEVVSFVFNLFQYKKIVLTNHI